VNKVGLWQVVEDRLTRIPESALALEKSLEDWIAEDPSLLQAGLVVVGRQIDLEGGRLDLLAIDPQGRWTIIEIKRGALRRETIAQALDYAACIAALSADELRAKIEPYLCRHNVSLDTLLQQREAAFALEPEQRELVMVIVGTGRAPGLDRMAHFLADRYGTPLTVVTFEVFALEDHRQILVREITEVATSEPLPVRALKTTLAQVLELAERSGTAQTLRHCVDICERLGLYARPWKASIMFAPPANRTRALFTIWAQPQDSSMRMWVGTKVFAEFYPISEESVAAHLGTEGWRLVAQQEVETFLLGLQSLFQAMQSAAEENDG
jgi:Holliday junction resolvase-like predicted endonuclease